MLSVVQEQLYEWNHIARGHADAAESAIQGMPIINWGVAVAVVAGDKAMTIRFKHRKRALLIPNVANISSATNASYRRPLTCSMTALTMPAPLFEYDECRPGGQAIRRESGSIRNASLSDSGRLSANSRFDRSRKPLVCSIKWTILTGCWRDH